MQPSSREMQMQSLNTLLNHQQQSQMSPMLPFDTSSSHDDFLEQMFSSLNNPSPNWPPSDTHHHLKTADEDQSEYNNNNNNHFEDDQSSFMTSKLRHHQINNGGGSAKALMLQQQQLMLSSRGLNGNGLRSPTASGEHNHLLQMPLSLTTDDHNDGNNDTSVQALFNGFSNGSLGQTSTSPPPHFGAVKQAAPPNGSTGAGTSTQPRQQRVRARRGQATDPHSIAERLRRERIAERMKALQELVPNGNKTDKASMLDEIIDYVKFLQLQVKVLSMSRLGGAATVTPLVGDVSSEVGPRSNGTQSASPPSNNDNSSTAVTEQQVAKLMEEDMGSAMQYLQGKGLCLMPISLATAISTATHSRNPMNFNTMLGPNTDANGGGPTSPNTSVLTVQSTTIANGGDVSTKVKDGASISK